MTPMLSTLGLSSLEELVDQAVPESIRSARPLQLPEPLSESEVLALARRIASRNQLRRSFIGCGYYDCVTPPVIQRNILENPGWYTQYTPYQAEISQGRLEALLNFQTLVVDLTGLELANASLLDEGTAAAEALTLCHAARGDAGHSRFFVAEDCHPQTTDVIRTRAAGLGMELVVGDVDSIDPNGGYFGVLVQYPATDGRIRNYRELVERVHTAGGLVAVATDLLALTLLTPPGEWGADVALGSSQRFGVPMGFGGPHAAFFAVRDEHKRLMPGRIVGVSRDAEGQPALRLALQTREQHIRRERATSNICTAQVLLAIVASTYAVYHGPDGLRHIASRVAELTAALGDLLQRAGLRLRHGHYFDTLRVDVPDVEAVRRRSDAAGVNLRHYEDGSVGISLDETSRWDDVTLLTEVMAGRSVPEASSTATSVAGEGGPGRIPPELVRTTPYLEFEVFHRYRSETELLRYMHRLQNRDLSLTGSMIPLGSCTMKLNAAVEMMPITWPEWCALHPFAPLDQAEGYLELICQLEADLAEITGMAAVSLQPNSGAQGEYTGLMTIRGYLREQGEGHRDVCLIPQSAHGTNPASAVMAGLKVVPVRCQENGDIDLNHLQETAQAHRHRLAALMVTYPSTHGVFEEGIVEICRIIHECGGQVYMDGANMNALVGLCRPGEFGVDVCHLNLHKTFCIPHGGGGPGVGPIAVAPHLVKHLPGHRFGPASGRRGGAVASAPFGSASILPIPWAYIRLMGASGLRLATQAAILNANYVARRLDAAFPVLYRGKNRLVAHECILDCRRFKRTAGVTVADIAKRLMDYGFHAPTVSWPVVETVMVEPTESESRQELDRFCEAMLSIRREIEEIELGLADRDNNVLKNAPHTAERIAATEWLHPYSREKAAFPLPSLRRNKFWTVCSRVDDTWGDRHLFCSCAPLAALAAEA
jgi:glycine dehydrogenase